MNNEKLASELLHELKASARRWFIAFCIMCGIEVSTIIGFLAYLGIPIEEYSIEQNADTDNNSETNQIVGGDINGKSIPESDIQEEKNNR